MIAHLILLSLYCAVGKTHLVHYSDNLKAMTKVKAALEANVLSMDGNIPLLNDPRRHYAQIVHHIIQVAKTDFGCIPAGYDEQYAKILITSAEEALINPQAIIDEVKNLIKSFDESTSVIQTLIEKFHGNDSMVNAIVNAYPEKYGYPATVFVAVGNAAIEYNLKDDVFNYVSQQLSALQFLVQGAKEVEDIVLTLGSVYHSVYKPNC